MRKNDAALISAYAFMGRAIEDMGLEGVWDLKPMFNGGEVKEILPNIPYGPEFSKVMQVRGKMTKVKDIRGVKASLEGTK